jgi:Ca2+-binding EF-hand superfamily protein
VDNSEYITPENIKEAF